MGLSKQEKNGWGAQNGAQLLGALWQMNGHWAMGMMMIDADNSSDGSNTTEQDNTNILYTVIIPLLLIVYGQLWYKQIDTMCQYKRK